MAVRAEAGGLHPGTTLPGRSSGSRAGRLARGSGRLGVFGRFSVRGKLVVSYSILSVLVLATILAGLAVADSARSGALAARTSVAATRVLKQLQEDGTSVAVAENSVAFDYVSRSPANGDLQSFAASTAAFTSEARAASRLALDATERADLHKAVVAFDAYAAQSKQINADYAKGTRASLAAAAKGVAALAFSTVTTPINSLVEKVAAQVNTTTAASLSTASSDRGLLIGLGIFVILLAIASAVAIVRSITRPIAVLNRTLAAVTRGDLSARAELSSTDELGQLADAMNAAIGAQEQTRREIALKNEAQTEMSADNAAVLAVLNALRGADSVDAAARLALEGVREQFGWAYGSYWAYDTHLRQLAFAAESGSLEGAELHRLSQGATIGEGSDLDGRALARRTIVTSDGLEELSDSPRAVAARRLGVRAAACFPVTAGDQVVGTMSFFGRPGGPALSASRTSAMANAGQFVSQAVERIADQERERLAETELRDKVDQILDVVSSAASGDLTVEVPVSGQDAIGQVGTSLALFLGDLRDRMRTIGENTRGLAEAVAELSGRGGGSDEAEAALASGSVETVAAAAEELTASIQEIAKSAADAARVALEAASMAESTNSAVTSLGESSAEIGQVVKMITLIAEQTNMLALNATIEAARAGEAGKGFAVVASEVKDLARETTSATEDISARIQAIQSGTGGAVGAIRSIKEIVDRISELQSAIASAVEEQTATTNEIARSMSGAAQATGEIGRMTLELQGLVTRFSY